MIVGQLFTKKRPKIKLLKSGPFLSKNQRIA